MPGVDHEFVGLTDFGFVDFKQRSVPRAGTIYTEDYAAALLGATFSCAPVAPGEAPYVESDGTIVRNAVVLTLSFPAGAAGAAAFAQRVQREGAFVVFDAELLAASPSFAEGTPCAAQIPFAAPTYAVASAAVRADDALVLALEPTPPHDAHLFLEVSFEWHPDAESELARRASEGLPLGVDARRRRRLDSLQQAPLAQPLNLNWDGSKVVAPAWDFVGQTPGLLTCKGCYWTLNTATIAITLDFCLFVKELGAGTRVWWYTSKDLGGTTLTQLPTGTGAVTGGWVDCQQASFFTGGTATPTNPSNNNFFLNAQVSVTGASSASFNLAVGTGSTSIPAGSGNTGSCSTTCTSGCAVAQDSSTCTQRTPFMSTTLPITVTVSPLISATITGALDGTASWASTADFQGSLLFGTNAAASGGVRLGGKLTVPDFKANLADCWTQSGNTQSCLAALGAVTASTTQYPVSFSSAPYTLQSPGPFSGELSVDATLFVTTVVTLQAFVPFTSTQKFQLAGGVSSAVASCPSDVNYFVTANAKPISSAVAVGPVTLSGITSILTPATTPVAVANSLGVGTIVPRFTIGSPTLSSSQALIAACVPFGPNAFTGSVGGGTSALTTVTGTSGAAQRGGSVTLITGLADGPLAGVIIGCLVGGVLVAFAVYKWRKRSKAARKALTSTASRQGATNPLGSTTAASPRPPQALPQGWSEAKTPDGVPYCERHRPKVPRLRAFSPHPLPAHTHTRTHTHTRR